MFCFNDFQSDRERTGDKTICSYPNVVFTFVYIPNKFFRYSYGELLPCSHGLHDITDFMVDNNLHILCTFLIVGRFF